MASPASSPGSGSKPGVQQDEAQLKDRYDLGDVIGTGAFGTIKLAKDKSTGRNWACKIVPLLAEKDKEAKYGERLRSVSPKSLLQEVEIHGSMKDTNITRLREAFIEG
eukprot:scaffold354070_cov33-Prasinocladus_malaysianus.AAC.1